MLCTTGSKRSAPFATTIESLVPKARVVCAHGQMHESELARIMKEFIAGRFGCAGFHVIIENGLDIPMSIPSS